MLAAMTRTEARGYGAWLAAVLLALTMMVSVPGISHAQTKDESALKILKAMSDYVAAQKNISATFDTDIEVITSNLQKIQFTSSGSVKLNRPNNLHATRTGGYADVELMFDGTNVTILAKHSNTHAEIKTPGSIDELVMKLRDEFDVAIPGADLLLAGVYDQLTAGVLDAKHIGHGVVDGVECEHLAFRNEDTDWQIWIETGARPIPRKYVITSKAVTSGPQYTLRVKTWGGDAPIAADAFTFKAPEGAKKVEPKELQDIDEVPAGTIAGDKK